MHHRMFQPFFDERRASMRFSWRPPLQKFSLCSSSNSASATFIPLRSAAGVPVFWNARSCHFRFALSHFTRLSVESHPCYRNPDPGPSHHKIPQSLDRRSRSRSNHTDRALVQGTLRPHGVGPYAPISPRQDPAA